LFAEFTVELRRERLVVRKYEGRFLNVFDNLGHGKCFTRTGNAQQRLMLQSRLNSIGEQFDRLCLIAGWRIS